MNLTLNNIITGDIEMENKLGKTWLVMKTVIITFAFLYMIGDTKNADDLEAELVRQSADIKKIGDLIVKLHK